MGMRPTPRLAGTALFVVSLFVATACGQTVPHTALSGAPAGSGGGGSTSTGGGGLSVPSSGTSAGSVSTGGGGGGISTGGGTTGSTTGGGGTRTGGGGTSAGGGTAPGGGGGGTTTVSSSVPGVTPTTIYVGTFYTKNQASANAALGANTSTGNGEKAWQIVIDDINKHGGLAGRKLVQISYGYDANSTQTTDQQDQAACAKWTQDNKVFAVMYTSSVVDQCTKKAGVLETYVAGAPSTPQTYREFPQRFDIDGLNSVREGTITIDGLHNAGYFDKGYKLGFVTWDDPAYHTAVNQGYLPALRRDGIDTSKIQFAYLHSPQSPQEIGQTSADASNAILKFKSLGIDHVIILDGPSGACGGSCIMLEWMRQADSQNYKPRYGLNDSDGPPSAALSAGLIPADQLHRSISVGWIDYDQATHSGLPPNAGAQRCKALMRRGGYDTSDLSSLGFALNACDSLWFVRMAFSRIQGAINDSSFTNAVNGLGYSFSSVETYGNYFSATRHDGLGGARLAIFNDGCSCYKYPHKPYRV